MGSWMVDGEGNKALLFGWMGRKSGWGEVRTIDSRCGVARDRSESEAISVVWLWEGVAVIFWRGRAGGSGRDEGREWKRVGESGGERERGRGRERAKERQAGKAVLGEGDEEPVMDQWGTIPSPYSPRLRRAPTPVDAGKAYNHPHHVVPSLRLLRCPSHPRLLYFRQFSLPSPLLPPISPNCRHR